VSASQLEAYLPLVLLIVVGYLLLIRPARRRARATAELQATLSPGDEVMLSSGLFGTVVGLRDEVVQVELGPGMVVRVHRGAVTQIIKDRRSPFEDTGEDAPRPDGTDDTRAVDPTADDNGGAH
jgi:preprotein translocase subunit YajC